MELHRKQVLVFGFLHLTRRFSDLSKMLLVSWLNSTCYMDKPLPVYPFTNRRTLELVLYFGYCEKN